MNNRLDSFVRQARQKIADANDPGNVNHLATYQQLVDGADPEDPPYVLTGSYIKKKVTVYSEQMGRLTQAQDIALAVKRLVKSGNQKLLIKATNGENYLLQDYAQDIPGNTSTTDRAVYAVLLGATNCVGHGSLAFKITQSLNLPSTLRINLEYDHTYVNYEGVIIDAWPYVTTVCREQDFEFNTDNITEQHSPDTETPNDFNLAAILGEKKVLEERLGKDGVVRILFEEKRKEYGISSKTLDHHMLNQCVTNYFDIDVERPGLSQADKNKITKKLEKIRREVEQALLKEAERACGLDATTEVRHTTARIVTTGNGSTAENNAATQEAMKEAMRKAKEGAIEAAEQKAFDSAQRKVTHKATKDVSYTYSDTVSNGEATVTAIVTATARARMKGYLWNQHFTAKEPLEYEVKGGEARKFNHVPGGHTDELMSAWSKPNITFTKTDERKAKLRKYMPSTLSRKMNALGGKVKETVNKIAGKPAPVTQAELQAAAEQVVTDVLSTLRTRRNAMGPEEAREEQTRDRQKALLEKIDKRMDGVSRSAINSTTAALMRELEYLHPELRDQACDMVERWAYFASKRISDQAMDEVARVRNMTSSSDDESL